MDNGAPLLGLGVFLFVGGLAALLAGPQLVQGPDDLHLVTLTGCLALLVAAVLLGWGTYLFAQDHYDGPDD